MEIKTCEHYVLARLAAVEDERDGLLDMLETVKPQPCQCEAKKTPFETHCLEIGRKTIYSDATDHFAGDYVVKNYNDGGVVKFDDFCRKFVNHLPEFMSLNDFMREYETELESDYFKRVESVNGGAE